MGSISAAINANAKLSDVTSMSTSNTFGGPIGGAHLGYNVLLPSHILLGAEVDATFPNYIASNAVIASVAMPQNQIREELDYVATARGRLGYVYGPWLLYGTGGVALMGSRFLNDLPSGDEEKQLRSRVGGVVGGGAEYVFDRDWNYGSNIFTAALQAPMSHFHPERLMHGLLISTWFGWASTES